MIAILLREHQNKHLQAPLRWAKGYFFNRPFLKADYKEVTISPQVNGMVTALNRLARPIRENGS